MFRQRINPAHQVADRTPWRDRLGGGDNGVGVDAIVPVEVRDRTGLAEMLDPKRTDLVAIDGAEPGERRRMAVEHADNAAMRRQAGHQPFNM